MKNLSNVSVPEYLTKLQQFENFQIEFEGSTYPMPYSTMVIQDHKLQGLRENEERLVLFDKIIDEYVDDKNSYLDVGSNQGVFVRHFNDQFENVAGVEASPYYIDLCRFLYSDMDVFTHADLNQQPLSSLFSEPVDVITSLSMIEYIHDKKAFVEDLYNLTGKICIVEGHSEDFAKNLDHVYEGFLTSQDWTVVRRPEVTDPGLNAPPSAGRPLWVCIK